MKENLTPHYYANLIKQLRSSFVGSFLLVEGRSDKLTYKKFVDRENCQIRTNEGDRSNKEMAIAILDLLEQDNFQGVLAIVDADFDRLETSAYQSPNLLRTDTHDLETMILRSPALEDVTSEFGSEEKLGQLTREMREILLEAGTPIGYLLWISLQNQLNLKLEEIEFENFIDRRTLKIDLLKLIEEVINKSRNFSIQKEELLQKLTEQKSDTHDRWQICRGHDLVEILSLGFRLALGSKKKDQVKREDLERSLRLAYEREYFRETQLFLEIRAWENNHQPFRVLPDTERS